MSALYITTPSPQNVYVLKAEEIYQTVRGTSRERVKEKAFKTVFETPLTSAPPEHVLDCVSVCRHSQPQVIILQHFTMSERKKCLIRHRWHGEDVSKRVRTQKHFELTHQSAHDEKSAYNGGNIRDLI